MTPQDERLVADALARHNAEHGRQAFETRHIMASEITLNGLSEDRECPVCGTMAKVSHGIDAAYPMHYWECPECGDSVAIVCYNCGSCGQKVLEAAQ